MDYVENIFSAWEDENTKDEFYFCYLLMCYISLPDARQRIRDSIDKFLISCLNMHNRKKCCMAKKRHHMSHYVACIFSRVSAAGGGGKEVLAPKSVDILNRYLEILVNHSTEHSHGCKECVLPRKIANSFPKKNFVNIGPPNKKGELQPSVSFSDEKNYGVSKLMKLDRIKRCVVFVFPSKNHVCKESIYVLMPPKEEVDAVEQ